MKSGIRIFKKNVNTSKGKLLPLSEFRPFREFAELKVDEEKVATIIGRAERNLEEELTAIPLSLFRDYFVAGSRSRYEAKHHHRREMLINLTLAEVCEGKGRFIEKIADVAWAIMEESSWVIPAHLGNSLTNPYSTVPEIIDERAMPGLDLYAASCCATLATTKYFLGDKLDEISPVICKKIDHLIYLRGLRPFLSGNFWWTTHSCNWVTNITNSILVAVAYTVSDMNFREQLTDRAMTLLDNFTAAYPEDGCCDEGPGYWGGAAGSLFDSLELLDDMSGGKITVWHEPIIKNMCEFITTMNIHGKYYVNFEDCGPKLVPNGEKIMRMGEKVDSPSLLTFGRSVAATRPTPYVYFAFNYCSFKDAMTPVVKEFESVTAKIATYLEGHKIAVFRENSDTSRGFFLATKGGTNAEAGNHNDVGCLVIAKNGNPIVVDPGIGSYNNKYFSRNERYMRWYTNASYHSCPTVDGIEQQSGVEFFSKDEDVNTDERRASMDIGTAYPKEAGIVSLVRTSHLTEGKVTVTDDVKLDHEGEISFHFTLHYEPKQDSTGAIDIGEGVLLNYDKALSLEIEKVENKCLPYDDLNFQSAWGVDNLWRLKFTVRAKEFKAHFEFV